MNSGVALLCVIVGVLGMQVVKIRLDKEQRNDIAEVFASIGVGEPEGTVESSGTYGEGYLELYKREELLVNIGEELGITKGYEITNTYENKRSETGFFKQAKQGSTTLYFVTLEDEAEDNVITTRQYLLARICIEDDLDSVMEYYSMVAGLMKEYCPDSNTTANLEGSYEGELSLEKRNQITDDLLEKLQAKTVTGNRDMELYTIYGYADWLEEYKLVDGKKININIAITYDEVNDKTLVYVATPIVSIDY